MAFLNTRSTCDRAESKLDACYHRLGYQDTELGRQEAQQLASRRRTIQYQPLAQTVG